MRRLPSLAPLAAAACALAAPATAGAATSAYQNAVIAGGPAVYWPLDDAPGATSVADLSGNDASGSPDGVALGAAPAFAFAGTAAGFPTGAAHIDSAPLAPQARIELWVRPAARGAQTLARQGDPAAGGWELALNDRKKLVLKSRGKTVDPKIALPVGAWSMVDVAWPGNSVWFVTNGGLAKSREVKNAFSGSPPSAPGAPLTVGGGAAAVGKGLDEVALYASAPASYADLQALARAQFDATALAQNTAPPSIAVPGAGAPVDGQTLTAVAGQWTSTSAVTSSYAWLRCDLPASNDAQSCDSIDGADGPTYTLTPEDIGSYIEVEESAANAAGSTFVDSSDVGPVVPLAPTIAGTATEGQTLTAESHTSTGAGPAFAFRWQRCDAAGDPLTCADVDGAAAATYPLAAADAGRTVRVVASAAGVSAASAPTAVIASLPATDPGAGGGTPTDTPPAATTDTAAPAPTAGAPSIPATAGATPVARSATCAVSLARVPRAVRARVRGIGRVRVAVRAGKAGPRVVVKAPRAKVARVALKLDRKVLKGGRRALHRTLGVARLTPGGHVLRVTLTPRRGKARTLRLALMLKGC